MFWNHSASVFSGIRYFSCAGFTKSRAEQRLSTGQVRAERLPCDIHLSEPSASLTHCRKRPCKCVATHLLTLGSVGSDTCSNESTSRLGQAVTEFHCFVVYNRYLSYNRQLDLQSVSCRSIALRSIIGQNTIDYLLSVVAGEFK